MTDPLHKAAWMALESLKWYVEEDDVIESMAGNEPWVEGKRRAENAIKELRQALAQPKQKPLTQDLDAPLTINGVALYPKKEWVGLTDADIKEGADLSRLYPDQFEPVARWAESKLKEKNHGNL
jgi:hypothetical protein